MRLLIYLLALISGFSAAEAARAQVAPASSLAQVAVVSAEALATVDQIDAKRPAHYRPQNLAVITLHDAVATAAPNTPVSRKDILRI